MSHNHNHISPIQSLNWVYYLAIALNFGFVILEAAVGLGYHSMGLLSDAGHKLFDVFSLFLGLKLSIPSIFVRSPRFSAAT